MYGYAMLNLFFELYRLVPANYLYAAAHFFILHPATYVFDFAQYHIL
jgi:hypothetical protein